MRVRALLVLCGMLVGSQAACTEDPAPLFQPTGTGSVAGQVFFDIDGNGQFNPLVGDTLARAGVTVQLRKRGTSSVMMATQTDANGEYLFENVPVGTHDLFIPSQPTTGALVFCTNPAPTSVYVAEQAFRTVAARNGCVIRIADAEAKPLGEIVTIYGVITAAPGTYRSDNFYLQDGSGGMQVFGFINPASLTLNRGDSVEVTGTLGQFNTEIQLVSGPRLGVTKQVGTQAVPDTMTAAEIIAVPLPAGRQAGMLVTIRKVTVGTFGSGTSGINAPITDATGSIEMRVEGGAMTLIPTSTFGAGKCYDITGVLGHFNALKQVKPRDLADVTEVSCS
jgi:DNA/RNA endonuclease YhcR with UshA esterase domain